MNGYCKLFALPPAAQIKVRIRQVNDKPDIDYASVEARRSPASSRTMSFGRRVAYRIYEPLLRVLIWLLNATYRYQSPIGARHIDKIIAEDVVCAPCYWHQHHLVCAPLIRRWIERGFKACFLVSSSVDGEVPERIARSWGAEVIRGSANVSGTLALRDQQAMFRRGYSIITTADGPRGPKHEFKSGVVLMARIAGVPIVPVGYAASSAWHLKTWDGFIVPKPFARIVVGIGEPYPIPRDAKLDELEPHRLNVQAAVMSVSEECENALQSV